MNHLVLSYLIVINATGFLIMLLDKHYAKTGHWRIRESTLLTVSVLGGSLGSLLGMYTAHHKTRKPKFQILVPLFLLLHIVLFLWYWNIG